VTVQQTALEEKERRKNKAKRKHPTRFEFLKKQFASQTIMIAKHYFLLYSINI